MKAWRAVGQYWYVFALLLLTCVLTATLFIILQPQRYTATSTLAVTYQSAQLADTALVYDWERWVARRLAVFSHSDMFWERVASQPAFSEQDLVVDGVRSTVHVSVTNESDLMQLQIVVRDTDRERSRAVIHAVHRTYLQSHAAFHGAGPHIRIDSFLEPSVSLRPDHPSVPAALFWSIVAWVSLSLMTIMGLFLFWPMREPAQPSVRESSRRSAFESSHRSVSNPARQPERKPMQESISTFVPEPTRGSASALARESVPASVREPRQAPVRSRPSRAARFQGTDRAVLDYDGDGNGIVTMQETLHTPMRSTVQPVPAEERRSQIDAQPVPAEERRSQIGAHATDPHAYTRSEQTTQKWQKQLQQEQLQQEQIQHEQSEQQEQQQDMPRQSAAIKQHLEPAFDPVFQQEPEPDPAFQRAPASERDLAAAPQRETKRELIPEREPGSEPAFEFEKGYSVSRAQRNSVEPDPHVARAFVLRLQQQLQRYEDSSHHQR